ncbi:MAG: KOW motif-containing protein [Candidatus Micrarchaeota archaeon]|nr:KOW motif-containing protein [Candidatus Micrarchaeota archaeon]MCX8154567.1 KOW motif-containing protein [Candidatus Micrarchaeota archaeon]
MIYLIPVVVRDAHIIAKLIHKRVMDLNIDGIYSIYLDTKIRGYLVIEAKNDDVVKKAISGVKGVKPRAELLVISESELDKILMKLTTEEKIVINIGDVVEIIKGPFAGEKAKVTAINSERNLYTVIPLDLPTIVPIDIPAKNIKLLKSSKE